MELGSGGFAPWRIHFFFPSGRARSWHERGNDVWIRRLDGRSNRKGYVVGKSTEKTWNEEISATRECTTVRSGKVAWFRKILENFSTLKRICGIFVRGWCSQRRRAKVERVYIAICHRGRFGCVGFCVDLQVHVRFLNYCYSDIRIGCRNRSSSVDMWFLWWGWILRGAW